MFLRVPVSTSRKNECRKFLWPLLSFALYLFSFKQQNLFHCFDFLGVFWGWFSFFGGGRLWFHCARGLFCANRSPREEERIDYMCN